MQLPVCVPEKILCYWFPIIESSLNQDVLKSDQKKSTIGVLTLGYGTEL